MSATTTYTTNTVPNSDGSGAQTTVYTPNPPTPTPLPPTVPSALATPPPVGAIPASSVMNPVTPPVYPAPTTTNTSQANTQLNGTLGAQGNLATPPAPDGSTTTTTATQPVTTTATDTARSGVLDSIMSIFKQQQGQAADTQAAQDANGVATKLQQVTDLTNKYAATKKSYDDKIASIQENKAGAGQGAVDGDVAETQRIANADLANISISLNAAQGNYNTAYTIAKQTVDAKYAPLKDEVATLQAYYNLSKDDLTESEQLQVQANIAAKQKEVDAGTAKDLAGYQEKLKEEDPLHAAQVAEAWASANKSNIEAQNGGGTGTAAERAQQALSNFAAAFVPGAKMADGTPTVDTSGYITPAAWKAAISDAPSESLTREQFITQFGSQIFTQTAKDGTVTIPDSYGLTPQEKKLILGS